MVQPRGQQQSAPAQNVISTRLLTEVFAGFEPGDRITVLDLGPGNAHTVNFLSRYRAKVYFADLLDNPILLNPPENTDINTLAGFITRQLALPDGAKIDVCLLWDHLHYIDLPTIEALSNVLEPRLKHSARGYGFGALHGKKPSDANQYGIAGLTELAAHPFEQEPVYQAHSQQRLTERFMALRIARGTLLREGRLELLFETFQ